MDETVQSVMIVILFLAVLVLGIIDGITNKD